MEDQVFRKKSLERISSPEELHDYLHVTTPRLWMILAAIAALLGGFMVYASVASAENTLHIKVRLQTVDYMVPDQEERGDGRAITVTGYLPRSQKDIVETGTTVRLGDERGQVSALSTGEEDQDIVLIITMDNADISLPDGEYDAELVLESSIPIRFLR